MADATRASNLPACKPSAVELVRQLAEQMSSLTRKEAESAVKGKRPGVRAGMFGGAWGCRVPRARGADGGRDSWAGNGKRQGGHAVGQDAAQAERKWQARELPGSSNVRSRRHGAQLSVVWRWISNIAILLGAEFNAEIERGRRIEAATPPTRNRWTTRAAD